jgi:hypothetical protein
MSDTNDAKKNNRVHAAIMAWHASPYNFDKFAPMRNVSGQGQGAATYGRGAAYLAESEKVSGPGLSEYMKEFRSHPEVTKQLDKPRYQIRDPNNRDNWIDLAAHRDFFKFHDNSSSQDLDHPEFGKNFVLSELSSDNSVGRRNAFIDSLKSRLNLYRGVSDDEKKELLEKTKEDMRARFDWEAYDIEHAKKVIDYLQSDHYRNDVRYYNPYTEGNYFLDQPLSYWSTALKNNTIEPKLIKKFKELGLLTDVDHEVAAEETSRMLEYIIETMDDSYEDHIFTSVEDMAEHYIEMKLDTMEHENIYDLEKEDEYWKYIKKHLMPKFEDRMKLGGPYSYRVAVHARPETLLDWDKPFSRQHPNVQEAILRAVPVLDRQLFPSDESHRAAVELIQKNARHIYAGLKTGRNIYENLSHAHALPDSQEHDEEKRLRDGAYNASEALYNAGVHGIRYLDGNSRALASELYIKEKDSEMYVSPTARGPNARWEAGYAARYVEKNHIDSVPELIQALSNSGYVAENALKWVESNKDKLHIKVPKRTYNYVIFHPEVLEILAKYNIHGDMIESFGPGAHFKEVDHNPFEDEDK